MPELPVKEVRLPELHLPEIDRDQIVSTLSGLRLPAVDLPTIERPRFGRDEASGGFDWRAIDWRAIDLGPAIAGAGALVRMGKRARPLDPIALGRRRRRGRRGRASPWPRSLAQPAVRERAGRTVRDVRARVDEARRSDECSTWTPTADIEADVETVDERGRHRGRCRADVAADAAADVAEAAERRPRLDRAPALTEATPRQAGSRRQAVEHLAQLRREPAAPGERDEDADEPAAETAAPSAGSRPRRGSRRPGRA